MRRAEAGHGKALPLLGACQQLLMPLRNLDSTGQRTEHYVVDVDGQY